MQINEHILKVKGTAFLSEGLKNGEGYDIAIHGSIISVSEIDKQDGTKDMIYSYKIETCDVLKSNGEILHSKDKKSYSKKLRNAIWFKYQESNRQIDFEDYYSKYMVKIISKINEV